MDLRSMGFSALIAASFVAWPIIGSYARAGAGFMGVTVTVGTAAVVTVLSLLYGQLTNEVLTLQKCVLLGLAAVANGWGVYLYSIIARDPKINTSMFVVTVAILMTLLSPLFSWPVSGLLPSGRQWAGIACGTVAIILLNKT